MIATRDIARFAAKALSQRDFSGVVIHELLGPRDLSMAEATRILGSKIGKPDLRYMQIPRAEMEQGLARMGISPAVAASYGEMAEALSTGKIRSLEGRNVANTTPTAFEEFADLLAAAYRSS
jgi:uncharacterized protein YbjT (DUF2867 family)